MNARFTIAQANSATPTNAPGSRTVKITQPANGQAVVVELGYTQQNKLDLSAIADKKITLVPVGEKLIILFDNQSTLEMHPYFDSMNAPPPNITIKVSPRPDVTTSPLAPLLPLTDDQSVLPAAGAAGGPASGANFTSVGVDPLSTPNPLPLLGPEELPNFITTRDSIPIFGGNDTPKATDAKLVFFVEEEELSSSL